MPAMYNSLGSCVIAVGLACASLATAQTPPGTNPSTSQNLAVSYGDAQVTPNILLPQTTTLTQPTVYANSTLDGTYLLLLVDLSIPASSFNGTPRAPGLQPCRTTRLHWFQGNVTQSSNGSLGGGSTPIAAYGGPHPGLNDIAHTYTFYLFNQPANFSLPAWDAGRDYLDPSASTRMNFSVDAIAGVAGAPVAANYIRVQNPNNTATGTASNGTCPGNGTTGTNGTTTGGPGSPTSSPVPYTGTATMGVQYGLSAALLAVTSFAFALL